MTKFYKYESSARLKSPPKSYNCDTPLVTCYGGNVYNGNHIAEGRWTKKGFLLIGGALISKTSTIHTNIGVNSIRKNIKNDGLLIDYDSEYDKLNSDILLPSPSCAANLVHGNDRNGQECWTNSEGMWLKHL